MALLKSIELSGWKSIKHARVDFGPINVLIGANGSGKSNFVSFFKLLSSIAESQLQSFIATAGGANSVLYYGAKTTPTLSIRLEVDRGSDETEEYRVRLADSAPDKLVFTGETLTSYAGGEKRSSIDEHPTSHWESPSLTWSAEPGFGAVAKLLRQCSPYHVNDTSPTALIRRAGNIEDNRVLRSDAANLAAVLYRFRSQMPDVYKRIVGTIRQINPQLGDFVLEPRALNTSQILLNWREKGKDLLFGPHHLSDGTLRAMALVTLLLQPEEELPSLLVIDEPELGLHPYAVGVIAALTRKAAEHCQVLIATQSPQLLDHFDVSEVIVVDRPGEETTFTRLDESGLAAWLEDYELGGLWEKNVLGGGPH